eukprot:TRINITY_DN55585_c0_g1_i1.p1 TRINITY_DN55585_c0_g1~~TRINITY_DN55585_c0_g1_i1.p1  ORF type:complete len:1102 (+),score=275.72 TRINITY_DN55585_c0_g1_i1:79-3306(+)
MRPEALWICHPRMEPPVAVHLLGDLLQFADAAAAAGLLRRSGPDGRVHAWAAALCCALRCAAAFRWRRRSTSDFPRDVPGRRELLLSLGAAALHRATVRKSPRSVRWFWAWFALTAMAQQSQWALVHPETLVSTILQGLWFSVCACRAGAADWLRDGRSSTLSNLVMAPPPFPTKAAALPDCLPWVQEQLRRCGALDQAATVQSITVRTLSGELILGGTEAEAGARSSAPCGFIGETVRVCITYSGEQGGPPSVIAKMATQRLDLRVRMRVVATYLRETEFYRQKPEGIAHRGDASDELRVPRAFGVGHDDRDGCFALLLEDMAPWKPGDETMDATWQMAQDVALRYSSLHAAHWSPTEAALDAKGWGWLRWFDWMALPKEATRKTFRQTLPVMLEQQRYRKYCSAADQRMFTLLCEALPLLLADLKRRPATLIHADARQENMLFGPGGEGDWCSCDWQTFSKGVGVYDVAYFVALCVGAGAEGPEEDRKLVSQYYAHLRRRGVDLSSYTEEQCWDDYRICVLIAALIPIAVMDPKTLDAEGAAAQRAGEVREAMLRRAVATTRRVDSAGALAAIVARRGARGALACAVLRRPAGNHDSADDPLVAADEEFGHHTPQSLAAEPEERRMDAYDRWFLNGYPSDDCSTSAPFFAAAFGVYPARRVVDAAVCFLVDGRQHNVRASRVLDDDEWPAPDAPPEEFKKWTPERILRKVGPISIDVLEPLQSCRLRLEPGHVPGFSCDISFRGRFPAQKEPRFDADIAGVGLMSYTRLTQLVEWSGDLEICGKAYRAERWWGTRDRSWGLRPHKHCDPGSVKRAKTLATPDGRWIASLITDVQKLAGKVMPQFYWLWAPMHLPNGGLQYHSNEHADGVPWNSAAIMFGDFAHPEGGSPRTRCAVAPLPLSPSDAAPVIVDQRDADPLAARMADLAGHAVRYQPGTRHAARFCAAVQSNGRLQGLLCEPTGRRFFMTGLGYSHPTWGHGVRREGQLGLSYDVIETACVDMMSSMHWHIQEVVRVTPVDLGDVRNPGAVDALLDRSHLDGPFGVGVVEQLIVGPHSPSGLHGVLDATPDIVPPS